MTPRTWRRSNRVDEPRTVYVVSSGLDVDQVFVTSEDAQRFAVGDPAARVSRHQVRRSWDEALVVFERRVVVTHEGTMRDQAQVTRTFVDDPHDVPEAADVEWFFDTSDHGWHIVGFGLDESEVNSQVDSTIDLVRQLIHESPMEDAR